VRNQICNKAKERLDISTNKISILRRSFKHLKNKFKTVPILKNNLIKIKKKVARSSSRICARILVISLKAERRYY
jgi:hypothetical protein